MKMRNKLTNWLKRSSSPKRVEKLDRAVRTFMEPLEDRQMLSLLGITPLYPDIPLATGTMNYTYSTSTGIGTLTASATPHNVQFSPTANAIILPGADGASFNISFNVNGTGGVIPGQGTLNPNLIIDGDVTDPNTGTVDNGVLLEGKIVAFGSLAGAAGTQTSNFDFDFAVTGGLLASYFAGSDIGVSILSQGNTFTGAFNTSWSGGNNNLAGVDGNVGPIPPSGPQFTPGIKIIKSASCSVIAPGQPDTYTYVVTNTGNITVNNIVVTDDDGVPSYPGATFTVGTIASLAPGASATLTAVVIPVVTESTTVNGTTYTAGQLITQELSNGNVEVTYLQNQAVFDNTYGTNAVGWGSAGHTFAQDINDNAEFNFTNGQGQSVFDFNLNYIGKDSADPSGYGTLGVNGGNGQVNVGKASWLVSYDTSLSDDVNNPAFLPVSTSGVLVNSPASPNTNWNYVSSYTVVVSAAAFGSSGFGGVTVPCVEDCPSKITNNCSNNSNCNANNCYANFCNSNCWSNLCGSNCNTGNSCGATNYAQWYNTWYNNCYNNNSCGNSSSNNCNNTNYYDYNCNTNSYWGGNFSGGSSANNGNGNNCNSNYNSNCDNNCNNYNCCDSTCYDFGSNSNYCNGSNGYCTCYGNNNCTSNCTCNLCLVPTSSTVTNTATATGTAGSTTVTATGTATVQVVPGTNVCSCSNQFDCCCWANSSCENCFDCGSSQNFGCGGNYNFGCGSNQYNNNGNSGCSQYFFSCGSNNYYYETNCG
jgi:hypothetical protein